MGRPRIHPKEFKCEICNKIISNINGVPKIRFCSDKCKGHWQKEAYEKGIEFQGLKLGQGWNKGLNVSGMSGKKQTKTQKEALRKANNGRHISNTTREKMRNAKLGKLRGPMSDEVKYKISIAQRGVKKPSSQGSNNPKWKGGISKAYKRMYSTSEYQEWRRLVFERDNYTCQKCGDSGYVTAHHIKAFSKYPTLRFDINNGLTLCEECHKQTDNYAGRCKA